MAAVDATTFRLASVLCTMDLHKLHHLLLAFGLPASAGDIDLLSIDKGSLIARLVTRGLTDENTNTYSAAEQVLIGMGCLAGMKEDGATTAELHALLNSVRGDAAYKEALRRMRTGART